MDSIDGKTEWFLAPLDDIVTGINKIRKALYYMYGDKHGLKAAAEDKSK